MSSGYVRQKINDSAPRFMPTRIDNNVKSTLNEMVQNNNSGVHQKLNQLRKSTTSTPREVEEAVMILLFQIAAADGVAQGASIHLISEGLKRVLFTPQERIMPLLNNAKGVLQNRLLSTSSYTELLKDTLTNDIKLNIMAIADDMIRSMGEAAEVAVFYRNRLADSIGIS